MAFAAANNNLADTRTELSTIGYKLDTSFGATYKDSQKTAKTMFETARLDLASGKISANNFATIENAAIQFLEAAQLSFQSTQAANNIQKASDAANTAAAGPPDISKYFPSFDASGNIIAGPNVVINDPSGPNAHTLGVNASNLTTADSSTTSGFLGASADSKALVVPLLSSSSTAVVDNSTTSISNPQTTIINQDTSVRDSNPNTGLYRRGGIGSYKMSFL
jgi:hypothetical protein